MSGNSHTVNINVTDNGSLGKVEASGKAVNKQLEAISSNATTASKALSRTSSGGSNTLAAAKRATTPTNDRADYSVSRGLGGSTGAEGRDFAKQARGLGGLVHVYATFAANIFAVSAAFTALKTAADTTNLVKGLDQLGASSGKNLGTLSKHIVQITDGAVSLREAMASVAQASSGGMSSKNIERMAMAAKQTSQALGISMPDALSRLSRGITKIEPELLDELGIMVKVDQASQDYARSLGKSASSLTDFEKRQGFANAVLAQAEEKFAAIDMAANPYSKLTASLADVIQSGLELVNKVLGPLVNILSKSPTGLIIALSAVGGLLLKMAMPVLSDYKGRMNALASAAAEKNKQVHDNFSEYQARMTVGLTDELNKRAKLEKSAAAKTLALMKTADDKLGIKSNSAIGKGISNLDKLDAKERESLLKNINTQQTKAINLANKLEKSTGENAAADKVAAAAAREKAAAYGLLAKQVNSTVLAQEKAAAQAAKEAKMMSETKVALGSGDWQRQQLLKRSAYKAKQTDILKEVAGNTEGMGVVGAFKQLQADMTEKGLDKWQKLGTGIKGAMGIATSAISTAMAAFGPWVMLIGLVVTGVTALFAYMSTNAKETEKFNSALEGSNEATDTLVRTLDTLNKNSAFSVKGIQARATAFQGVADSVEDMVLSFGKLQDASGAWDRVADGFWDFIGKGSADKLATNLSKSISTSLLNIQDTGLRQNYISKLQEIVGKDVDVSNISEVETALRKLNNVDMRTKGQEIVMVLKNIASVGSETAATLTAASNGISELGKTVQTQLATLMPTDYVGKLGNQMMVESGNITKALKDPINSITILNELASNSASLSLLSPNTAETLIKAVPSIKKLKDEYSDLTKGLLDSELKLQKLKDKNEATQPGELPGEVVASDAARLLEGQISTFRQQIESIKPRMAEATKDIGTKIAEDFLRQGVDKLNLSINNAMREGAIIAGKEYLSVIKDLGVNTADAEAGIRAEEIDMQRTLAQQTYEQAQQMARNSTLTEENSIQLALNTNMRQRELANGSELDRLEKENTKLLEDKLRIEKRKDFIINSKDPKAQQAAYAKLDTDDKSALAPMLAATAGYISTMAKLAGQSAASELKRVIDKETQNAAANLKDNKIVQDQLATTTANLNTQQSLSYEYDAQLGIKQKEAELSKLTYDRAAQLIPIVSELNKLELSGLKARNKAEYERILLQLTQRANVVDASFNKAEADAIRKNKEDRIKGEYEIAKKQRDQATQRMSDIQAVGKAELDNQTMRLSYAELIGAKSATASIAERERIDLAKQALTYAAEAARINDAAAAKRAEFDKIKAEKGDSEALKADRKAAEDSVNLQLAALSAVNAATVANISKTAEYNKLLAEQSDIMKDMVSLTTTLGIVFGKVGAGIGAAAVAMTKLAHNEEKRNIAKKEITKQLKTEILTDRQREEATKHLNKLEHEGAVEQLNTMGEIAGQTKKMFNEKSGMYKAMQAIEQANHAASLVMQAEKMASELAALPGTLAGGVSKLFEQGGWAGFAGAAALIAMISSLVGGFGGGTSAPTPSMTSEQIQKYQGTGISRYGTENGGGILGDSEARNVTIANGIEMIEKHTFSTMEYNNDMLDALNKIKENTSSLGKALIRIPGLTSSNPEARASGNWLTGSSSSSVVGKGIQVLGSIGDLISGNGNINTYKSVQTNKTGILGFRKSSSTSEKWAPLDNEATRDSIGGIFQGFVSVLEEAGKQLGKDSITAIVSGMQVSDNFLVDTMGLKGQELVDAIVSQVGVEMDLVAEKLFPELKTFEKIGESFSETVVRVTSNSQDFKLALESIGMSVKTLPETVGVVTDEMTANVVTTLAALENAKINAEKTVPVQVLDRVTEAGYEFSTVMQTIPANLEALTLAQENYAKALKAVSDAAGTSTANNIALQQTLIDMAGGMDKFISKSEFFKDNFLSEAEKLAPVQKRVTAEMQRLNLGFVTTREQFKDIVLSLDLTSTYGQNTYTALMNVAEGFAEVTKEADTAVESATKTREYEIRILELSGRKAEALAETRKDELKELSDTDKALLQHIWVLEKSSEAQSRLDELILTESEKKQKSREEELALLSDLEKPMYLYLYAMEDVVDLKKDLFTAYEKESSAITNTISKLRASAKTMREFSDSLNVGTESLKTPQERYNEAKSQFYDIAALAASDPQNSAEQALKDDAISRYQGAAKTFLETSRTYFASSDAYMSDLNAVLSVNESIASALDGQATEMEQQLQLLTDQVTALGYIQKATEDVFGAVGRVEAAINALALAQSTADSLSSGYTGAQSAIGSAQPPLTTVGLGTQVPDSSGTTSTTGWGVDKAGLLSRLPGGDANAATISQLYYEVFRRAPDQEGLTYWDIHGQTTAEILQGFLDSPEAKDKGIYGYARGGVAKGLSLVGEYGPELVDFKSPGRVYTNNQTMGLLGGDSMPTLFKEMMQELKKVNAELADLKQQQQKQTGDLIVSNYDATQKAGKMVVEAVEDSNDNWDSRNKVVIQ